MQQEIDGLGWPVAVQILGVNQITYESGNANACNGKDIPWLQEVASELVWAEWGVAYRDVVILDQDNVPVATYNLTAHDLADPANHDALMTLLQAAAGKGAARTSPCR